MVQHLMLLQGLCPEPVSPDIEICLSQSRAEINGNRIIDLAYCGIEEFSSLRDVREYLIFDARITSDDDIEIKEEYDNSGIIYAYDLRTETWVCKGRTSGTRLIRNNED